MTNDRKDVIAKVIDQLRTYIPEADKYMGRYILKGWADQLEAAALSQPSPAVPDSEMWRHKKSGGIYAWVMTVVREEDQKVLVVYRGVNDGVRWARPASEFYDGRFERIDADDQPTEPAQPADKEGFTFVADKDGRGIYIRTTEPAQPATQAGAGDRPNPMSREQIRSVLMAHGYTVKPGQSDLKPYVYEAAEELVCLARELPFDDPTTEQPGDAEDAARWRMARMDGCNAVWCAIGAGECGKSLDKVVDDLIAARAAHGKGG